MFHLFLLIQLIVFVLELVLQSANQILTQKSNLVLKNNSKSHMLPVSVKPAIPVPVSNFCVSSTLSNSSGAMIQKHSFDSHSFKSSSFTNSASQLSFCRSKFSSPKIPTTPKSSISVSPTNHNNFSSSMPYFIKSNDSKPASAPPQTSHLSLFSIKSSRRLFQSSTQACQSIVSRNQKLFNSASLFSLFEVSEVPFQLNATATLPFTIIPLTYLAICVFMLNLLFSFILLTCSFCFILNFNILIYILFTILVFTTFYTNSARLLFILMENNRSLIYLITEFIHIFRNGAIFNKMTFSNIKLSKKALLIVVPVFLKVKIRKALRCSIVSLEDLLKLNNICHVIRKFSNLSLFYLSSENFFSIHMKRVSAFLYYTASFILVIAIVFCQSNLFWDCANGFVNIFSVHNDFNATNNFIIFILYIVLWKLMLMLVMMAIAIVVS